MHIHHGISLPQRFHIENKVCTCAHGSMPVHIFRVGSVVRIVVRSSRASQPRAILPSLEPPFLPSPAHIDPICLSLGMKLSSGMFYTLPGRAETTYKGTDIQERGLRRKRTVRHLIWEE